MLATKQETPDRQEIKKQRDKKIAEFNSQSEPERLKGKRPPRDDYEDPIIRLDPFAGSLSPPDSESPPNFEVWGKYGAHSVTCSEVIMLLTKHGCRDISHWIDATQCPKLPPPVANGTIGNIFSGPLRNGTRAAIRKIRSQYDQAMRARVYDKRVAREIYMWSKCNHPNVLRIDRVAEFHGHLAILSRWEDNGNLLQYLSSHPSADRCQLSTSVCAGLAYLHGHNIIHGNLKGTNVLISKDGAPMLMDFGMASLRDLIPQINPRPKCSLRWTPPDLYNGKSTHTMSGDIYSLGMTILETFTSQVPFADLTDDLLVPHVAVSRNIPTRPETIPTNTIDGDRLWAILTMCWSYNPKNRPSAKAVRSEIASESADNLTPADHPISEQALSEMGLVIAENPDPMEHPNPEVDRSKTITVENVDPVDGPSTEAVRDETQATAAANPDGVDRPTTEEVPSKVETIRPERRKGALGRLRKWFSRKKKAE